MHASKYQQAILNWLQEGEGNGCCNAVAGSGKSTTLNMAAKALQQSGISLKELKIIVFGKANADDLIKKFGNEWKASISTLHSAGWSLVKSHLNIKNTQRLVNDNKYKKIAQDLRLISYRLPKERYMNEGELKRKKVLDNDADFLQLVDLVRLTNQKPDPDVIAQLCDHFNISDVWRFDSIARAINKVLAVGEQLSNEGRSFDFTDMIWLPVHWQIPFRYPLKFVLVDECQDLNATQLELSRILAGTTARMLFVGDPNQAIFGFAGADCYSYQNIVDKVNALELSLSLCYRCPRSHISLVNSIFPEIAIEPRQDAPEGIIATIKEEDLWQYNGLDRVAKESALRDGDLVLCRKTSPLVSLCIKLISRGIAATVKGRAIGKTLKKELEEIKKLRFPFERFGEAITAYRQIKSQKYRGLDNEEQRLEQLKDKLAAIEAIYQSQPQARDVSDLADYIDGLFSDDGRSPITLSTVHRAKGLEGDRIFIINPEDMPMNWRHIQPWERQQENNLLYVALTRSTSQLYIVGQPSWLSQGGLETPDQLPGLSLGQNKLIRDGAIAV